MGRLSLRLALVTALATFATTPAHAGEVFAKPPLAGGGINDSSAMIPDGSDWDFYSWDDFVLDETQTITEVRWRGGYQYNGTYPKATDFRVSFFESIAGGFQPVITALPEHESQEQVVATFHTKNNAGETYAGSSGGVTQYTYRFVLPKPVTLQGGVKYWFRVIGQQPGVPDWGVTTASTPGSHFAYVQGAHMFQNWPHDLTFSLHARWENLGLGLAGTTGTPSLTGSGSLAGGTNATIAVTGAKPSAPTWFVAGATRVDLPLFGGTLIPLPEVLVLAPTDASGSSSVTFTVPTGIPSGLDLDFQAWTLDPGAAQGVSASNGLAGTMP